MKKQNTKTAATSRVNWEHLEFWVREQIQNFIQRVLEEEVTEFLGREKYERKEEIDLTQGYRNGYGKTRNLTLSCGTVKLRRPRIRGLEERFESHILPLFARRTKEYSDLLPDLYLHGLAHGDFELALRGLLGEGAPLSASTVARLKEKWEAEWKAWSSRRLDYLKPVYLWVDGVYVKAGLEKEKAAVLVVIAGLSDGSKAIVYLDSGYRESIESWSEVLRDLRDRGLREPKLVIGDGHLGIWGALRNVFPGTAEQRCWNHRIINVLDRIPKKKQKEAKEKLKVIPYAETVEEAERLKKKFKSWSEENGFKRAATLLDEDWERMISFYNFPKEHWQHIRTTNVVESPFATLRIRTNAAKRFKKVENAKAVIWKMMMVAEKRFRRLNAPHLLEMVYSGVNFRDGITLKEKEETIKDDQEEVA